MSFSVFRDPSVTNILSTQGLILPNIIATSTKVGPRGSLGFNITDQSVYYSNGLVWIPFDIAIGLFSSGRTNIVNVSASSNPTIGQALIATSPTTAIWQPLPPVSSLFSGENTNIINIGASTNPTTGEVLTAVNGTTATWQPLPTQLPASSLYSGSNTNIILIGSATNPTIGEVLTATSATTATWQPPSAGGTSLVAQYATVGTGGGLGTVAAGQPLTYQTAEIANTNYIATTAVQGPFSASGTVFEIATAGTYQISFQQTAQANGSVGIYYGATLSGMLVLPYTLVGGATATSQTSGVFYVVCAAGSFVAICAAAGNSSPLNPYANASTTNAASTSVGFRVT